jgi:eukaryotic-like serine/threonine-protein kinase
MVHRDIKPANVLLSERGGIGDFVKVLDFGLAKALENENNATTTLAGSVTGTPLYLSPEAVSQSTEVDARSDLYAVGAVGYYLLVGKPLFDSVNVVELIHKQVNEMPPSPSQRLGRTVSPQLEAVLMRCLAKSPGDRPSSAAALADELERCPVTSPWTAQNASEWWRRFHPGTTTTPAPSTENNQIAATITLPNG